MCGISGFIDHNKTSTRDILVSMTDSLAHRGPDGSGYAVHQHDETLIGLGHRRLSIIDLSDAGQQPMSLDQLHIVYNGEVYNYMEIRQELEDKGHYFNSRSDTEVILHAYREWGASCVSRLTGMFAFVIYDAGKQEVFCARDRAGVKPFYYYHHQGLFLFASELKAFHRHPGFSKTLNLSAVAAFVQFGNVPAPHCIFEHCYKLTPGHTLSYSIRNQGISVSPYWNVYDAYNQPKLDLELPEAIKQTEAVLEKAFRYRMIADVPVGVFLSGGYDSAGLVSLLQKNSGRKIKTFTISVPDIGLNEAPFASAIAQRLGTDHQEIACTQKEALELIEELSEYYDEPFADSSAIPTSLVCRMARKQVTVALSADGGDEVFAGYNRYDYMMKLGRSLERLPRGAGKTLAGMMNAIPADRIPVLRNRYNFHNRYEKLKALFRDPSGRNIMLSLSRQYPPDQLQHLFKMPVKELDTAYMSDQLKPEFYTPLAYMMAVDYQTYLPDDILQKVDRASMSSGLEAREPFLDHHVIEWAARLPDAYKYREGQKKFILKEIVHQYIPKAMMDRPKMGFAIPIESWLANEMKDKLLYYLDERRLAVQGIFHAESISKTRDEFLNGRKELAVKVWYQLMFQMWYDKWMK